MVTSLDIFDNDYDHDDYSEEEDDDDYDDDVHTMMTKMEIIITKAMII